MVDKSLSVHISGGTELIFWIFVRKKPWCQQFDDIEDMKPTPGICSHICSHICWPTTSAERVLVQAGSPPSAYSAREQREGELSVVLGRHLGQHPHGIDQSSLAPNRATFQDRTIAPNRCIVPESGTAPNCCTRRPPIASSLLLFPGCQSTWQILPSIDIVAPIQQSDVLLV